MIDRIQCELNKKLENVIAKYKKIKDKFSMDYLLNDNLNFILWITQDISCRLCFLISATIGFGYALLVFHRSGISGDTQFWLHPSGLSGSSLDIRTTLSGYWWFVFDRWRWPLLEVTAPNWPEGANAARFDIVPIVGLLAKVIYSTAGSVGNLYPFWVVGCFLLNAVSLSMLVRALGQKGRLAAIVAGSFGAMAPFVHARFGHLALMAHWLPIFMLACYFVRPTKISVWVGVFGLCGLAASVHLYLFVITAAVATAIFIQAFFDKRCSAGAAVSAILGVLAVGFLFVWMLGILHGSDIININGDYRRYSMNLLSPIWPKISGVFGWTGIYL